MKVRAGSKYIYHANVLDACDARTDLRNGELVVVVNLYGAPKANTMGHCYVEREGLRGRYVGLVHTGSLHTVPEYLDYLRAEITRHEATMGLPV